MKGADRLKIMAFIGFTYPVSPFRINSLLFDGGGSGSGSSSGRCVVRNGAVFSIPNGYCFSLEVERRWTYCVSSSFIYCNVCSPFIIDYTAAGCSCGRRNVLISLSLSYVKGECVTSERTKSSCIKMDEFMDTSSISCCDMCYTL